MCHRQQLIERRGKAGLKWGRLSSVVPLAIGLRRILALRALWGHLVDLRWLYCTASGRGGLADERRTHEPRSRNFHLVHHDKVKHDTFSLGAYADHGSV